MRRFFAGIVIIIFAVVVIAGGANVWLYWMGEMPTQTIVATVALYAIPAAILGRLHHVILNPAPKREKRQRKPKQAPQVVQAPAPLPVAPVAAQAAPQRRIATPPTIGQATPALGAQGASMAPELRRFVIEGEREIQSYNHRINP